MNKHMFGIGHTRPPEHIAMRIDEIARHRGYNFIQVDLPGTGYQHWFSGPNRGFPFDKDAEKTIRADLESNGLKL